MEALGEATADEHFSNVRTESIDCAEGRWPCEVMTQVTCTVPVGRITLPSSGSKEGTAVRRFVIRAGDAPIGIVTIDTVAVTFDEEL